MHRASCVVPSNPIPSQQKMTPKNHHSEMSATPQGPIERALASAMASRQSTAFRSNSSSSQTPTASIPSHLISIPTKQTGIRKARKLATLYQQRVAIQWMREELSREGKYLFARTVREFPILFAGNCKAYLENASTLWSKREALADISIPRRRLGNIVGIASKGRRRLNVKAFAGRKRELWVADLYVALRSEFDGLHALDVELSPSFLVCATKHLVDTAKEGC